MSKDSFIANEIAGLNEKIDAYRAEVENLKKENALHLEGIGNLVAQITALKAALEKICHIRNNSHKHNAIGKCSDMWKTAATALKETGGQ